MWAARPHLGSIFEKLLHRKTFYLPAACPRKTSRIRFGKAGEYPQLALGIAIAPETLYLITTSWFKRQLRFFRFSLWFLFFFIVQFHLPRKCGLLAHISAAFLKNCCTEKLFICASHLLNRKPPLPIREKRFQMLFCLMRFRIRSDCFLCQFCLFL